MRLYRNSESLSCLVAVFGLGFALGYAVYAIAVIYAALHNGEL